MSDEQQPPSPAQHSPPQPPRVPSSQLFPTWKQALKMFFGSWALMLSAGYGCEFALSIGHGLGDFGEAIPVILALLVAAGFFGMLIGVAFVLMRTLHALFAKKDEPPTESM